MVQTIGEGLQILADMDIFFYVLPFLLIFALVYAILYKINIMGGTDAKDNKGVYVIIALAIGLMALQFDSVPVFFQIMFPKLGIGLSVLLAAMILLGLFGAEFTKKSGSALIFLALAGVIFVVIMLTSFEDYSWWSGGFWQNNMSMIVAVIIVIIFVSIVISGGGKEHNLAPYPLREWGTIPPPSSKP
ncbi:MAG: hypothetical protein WC533_04240 [Candidatus Pacearchaeota archaeon]